jgi:hypothetical protein
MGGAGTHSLFLRHILMKLLFVCWMKELLWRCWFESADAISKAVVMLLHCQHSYNAISSVGEVHQP